MPNAELKILTIYIRLTGLVTHGWVMVRLGYSNEILDEKKEARH